MAKLTEKLEAITASLTDKIYAVVGGTSRWMSVKNFFKSWFGFGSRNLGEFTSLANAVSVIGSTQAVLTIASDTTVSDDLVVPSTLLLVPSGSAQISVASGKTLTINSSPKDWPDRQVLTGNGSVKFGGQTRQVYARWFGSVEDGVTDDQAAIQKAIDSYQQTTKPHGGGDVIISGAAIGSTLTIQKNSIRLLSNGWGVSNEAPTSGFLKWIGSAGSPMVLIQDCWNSGVENLRFIGKSSAKPSAAIEFKRTLAATTLLNHYWLQNIWIGPMFGYDSDDAIQFDAGLLCSGTIDGDTWRAVGLRVEKATIGVDIQNGNASIGHLDTLKVTACGTGLKCGSFTYGTNWGFGNNELDIYITTGHRVTVKDFTTEGAEQFAQLEIAGMLYIEAGGFEVTNNIVPSGFVIDADQGSKVELKNCHFVPANDYTFSPLYKIRVKSPGGGAGPQWLKLDNVTGIEQSQIDVTGPGGTSHRTQVFFNRPPNGSGDSGANAINYLTGTEAFDEKRIDFAGALSNLGGPFKVKAIATPTNVAVVAGAGSGGTTYSYRVSAITSDGETLASSAVTVNNNATLSGAAYNVISWYPVIGAVAYKVYGRTGGSELLLATRYAYDIHNRPDGSALTSYKDDGSATPSGALPTANTTGRAYFEGGTTGAPGIAYASDATQGIKFDGTGTRFVQGNNTLLFIGNGGTVQFTFAGPLIPNFGSFQWEDGTKLNRIADGIVSPIGSAGGGIFEFLQVTSGGTPSTNSARIYAKDVAGNAEMFVKDEAGNETQISPHAPDGTWHFYSCNSKTGECVEVNMDALVKEVEKLSGKKFAKRWREPRKK